MTDYQNEYYKNQEGYQQYNQQPPIYNPPQYQPVRGMDAPAGYPQKNRAVAGMLAFFLGALGIHCFYLGNTSKGLTRLLISCLTFGVGAVILSIMGIVDGVKILDGRTNTDAYGFYLKD